MSLLYLYPQYELHPTTYLDLTYPEKGQHPHHAPMGYLGHKVQKLLHDKDLDVHRPRVDVRETPSHFYIDIDVPGVADPANINVRWTSMRNVLITTKVERPPIEEEKAKEEAPESAKEIEQTPTSPPSVEKTETERSAPPPSGSEPHLTVQERQIGTIMRAFNFPVDVDRDATTAKLNAGVLRLRVPKMTEEMPEHKLVLVDSGW